MSRKARSDRNHIIYELKLAEQFYIGVTYVQDGKLQKSLVRRWQKHIRRALTEDKNWVLCKAIRKHGPEAFEISILEVVRGKALAHTREREWIHMYNPPLNTDKRKAV